MDRLKKFYKVWFAVGIPFIVFVSVVMGAGGLSGGATIAAFLFYLSIPMVFYGTFIYFPKKIFNRKNNGKQSIDLDSTLSAQDKDIDKNTESSGDSFIGFYIFALIIFVLGIFVINH